MSEESPLAVIIDHTLPASVLYVDTRFVSLTPTGRDPRLGYRCTQERETSWLLEAPRCFALSSVPGIVASARIASCCYHRGIAGARWTASCCYPPAHRAAPVRPRATWLRTRSRRRRLRA